MKAVVAEQFGGRWTVAERPVPDPRPHDVLVQIEASGVCYSDVHQLNNEKYDATFPRVPGHEAVGRVAACGRSVERINVGDRVGMAYAQRWCGRCSYCEGGWYEHCASIDRTGFTVDGGHAELALMDAGSVELVPEGLDPVEAAPLFCAGFTVYSGICDAQLRPGDRCAVIGMGGLGHLGVQYAAALGAEVIAVTRSPGKQAALKELGADHIVATNGSDPGECLRRIGGADVIVHTGNGVEPGLLRGLRPFGRLSLVGVSPDVLAITPIEMIFDKVTIYGSCQGPRHRLREVLELHKRAKAKTVVEAYPLERALAAYDRVASGTTRFRAVLVP